MKYVGLLFVAACIQQGPQTYPASAYGPGAPPPSSGEPPPGPPPGPGPSQSGARDEIVMPDVTHKSLADATAILRQNGVTGEIHVQNEDGPFVCGTTPGAGNHTLGHLSVSVSMCEGRSSTGSADPDLRGMTVEQATKVLRDNGFRGNITTAPTDEFDPQCKPNTVCDFHPYTWSQRYGYGGDVTLQLNKR
ncbi:MAG: PASTA domain-containing protein [Kofleriaceae bacterium]